MERPLHVEGLKTEKAREPNRRKFNMRNLETESIRSRAESTGGCVKLKTDTEIRRSSACNTMIAETVYLVLNSLCDWEPMDRQTQE